MATPTKDDYLQSCSDWFSFHLSHVDDFELVVAESSWSECDKCRAVYESLMYSSHEGKFGLMTREFLENLMKFLREQNKLSLNEVARTRKFLIGLDKSLLGCFRKFRQRYKPKLVSSPHVRRGNVPQYVSFVSPMPVHLRPGTGESSVWYGSSPEISIVSEDLLISAGTQEEILSESEETGLKVRVKGGRLGLGEEYEATLKKDFDETRQEILLSPSSLLPRVSLSQYAGDSALDADGSIFGVGSSLSRDDDENDAGDMVNSEFEIGKDGDERKRNSSDTEGTDFNFEGMGNGFKSGLTNSSEDNFDQCLDNTTEVDGFNDRDTDGNRGTYEDNDDLGDTSALNGTTNDFDSSFFGDQDATKIDNNLQVTFSEPLATDGRFSPNSADNDDDENGDKRKSILKGNDDAKGKIYELEVEPSIMKRMISPVETSNTVPLKPVIVNRGSDIRSQSKPNINILDETVRAMKNESNDSNDDEEEEVNGDNSSDDEYISGRGGRKIRRPKPKDSIYAKEANLKARSEKFHKRKTSSGGGDSAEDDGMTAESSLLMQQILDEEKRLKDGMKPWLKGRLGLSQQNSRFEIPMDVRLLETMTPLDYLTNYCVISKRRKALYKHVFQRVDRNRGGSISYAELEKGLTDVHTGVLDSGHIENITKMININKESAFDLKQFSAVAAFSERISCKYHLPVELLNNLDGQKEIIESADFFALSWKLDGIHVNPAVKKILDSL